MDHRVTAEEDGRVLRDILRQVMGVSYSAVKSAKWDGRIRVDGQPQPVNIRVREGQTITMLWAEHQPAYTLKPHDLPLTVPYEDEHLLIIDKPAPLASQSSAGHPDDSLENALFFREGCPASFLYRPVNRLDKGTSGLMIVARTAHAQHRMQQMLHTPDFRRTYLAVVEGVPQPPCGVIDAPIGKEKTASIRRIICADGKPSVTHYETVKVAGNRSLVRLVLETGRTHQIRVHMQHIGCPVCGDFLYGTEIPQLPGRFALHSAGIDLIHPITGEALHIASPLPEALTALL